MTLKDVNLEIMPGEKVAICGRTGRHVAISHPSSNKTNTTASGKSSLLLLLLRLLNLSSGSEQSISIDGERLAKIDGNIARQRIIALSQDAVFLPDGTSFRMNLNPEGLASDYVCTKSLEAVGMWEYVVDHGGLSGELTADELSQGQKQLFALARAIVRRRVRAMVSHNDMDDRSANSPSGVDLAASTGGGLLILDEYNSSVDVETNERMQAIIAQEFKNYTVVMVSHRLETVMGFDRIVILDAGRVVEQGAPRTLLEDEGSRFRELWAAAGN